MFWLGRLNAILAIFAVVGLVIVWAIQGPAGAAGWLVFMFVLRITLRLANTIWTAATGNPLFYETKILAPRRGADE
ncbi:MAG: hypothetical protein O9289_17410 [Rhodobacteraceae bacterium]|nr:hypothetical protein [Paracoccaceae bacterium]MCZ8084979.1 hypothetical protein [Paracoccaceae bacterium]